MYGLAGNDTLSGGDGNDTIRANVVTDDTVNDEIDGDAGADTLVNTAAAPLSLAAFIASSQSIETINGNSQSIQGTIADNVLNFQIGSGTFVTLTAVASIDGLAGNDVITGTNAANIINGGTGNDSIYGLGGNDDLRGDIGDDYIEGGTGADTLRDGAGADTMKGGPDSEADTFIIEAGDVANTDVILDFNRTYGDVINISAYAASFTELSRAPYVGIWYPNGTEITDDGGKKLRLAGITNVNAVLSTWFVYV